MLCGAWYMSTRTTEVMILSRFRRQLVVLARVLLYLETSSEILLSTGGVEFTHPHPREVGFRYFFQEMLSRESTPYASNRGTGEFQGRRG